MDEKSKQTIEGMRIERVDLELLFDELFAVEWDENDGRTGGPDFKYATELRELWVQARVAELIENVRAKFCDADRVKFVWEERNRVLLEQQALDRLQEIIDGEG